jgi:hypothetical protein
MPGIPWARRIFVGSSGEMTPVEAGIYDASEITTPEASMQLQCTFLRSPGTTAEDVAVTTHNFTNFTGGAVDPSWDSGDFGTVETAMSLFWDAIKPYMKSTTVLHQYRWYAKTKATEAPATENPPVRVTSVSKTMTGTGAALPPQVALSVTEKTAARKNWGRFYIPSLTVDILEAASGRLTSGTADLVANAAKTMYETCATAELVPVVWSQKHKHAWTVERIQVDNIFDVIRRRRWETPTYRKSHPV